jgi:hypothetical protein
VQGLIHEKNLEHYRKLLAGTPDEAERVLLVRLLAEEEAKDPPWKMATTDDEHCSNKIGSSLMVRFRSWRTEGTCANT